MNNDLQNKSNAMQSRAYDMFPIRHKADEHVDSPFPMYSYERASTIFWSGFIDELYDRGLKCEQVEWLLKSKQMRWMFDHNSDKLEFMAKSFVDNDMVEAARREAE